MKIFHVTYICWCQTSRDTQYQVLKFRLKKQASDWLLLCNIPIDQWQECCQENDQTHFLIPSDPKACVTFK